METIADNLQILVDEKRAIKQSLINHKKEPTDKIATYSDLIDELENPDDITYLVTLDGENSAYTVLHGQEKVELNATPNDVRVGTTVVAENGVMDGKKVIPSYHTEQGVKIIPANSELKIKFIDEQYDYTQLQAMTAPYNTCLADSVAVNRVVIDGSVYNTGSTTPVSSVTKDTENKTIDLGIVNGEFVSVIRYFTYREEI